MRNKIGIIYMKYKKWNFTKGKKPTLTENRNGIKWISQQTV